jgi:hypothetical protein
MAGLKFFGYVTDLPGSVQHDILDLMYTFHDAKCSVDRDRLFALVGASRDVITKQNTGAFSDQIASTFCYEPDYTITTEQAYRSFAKAALQSRSAFKLLSCAGAFQRTNNESATSLPSWTPDWRCKTPLAQAPDYKCFTAGLLRTTNGEATKGTPAILVDETDWSITIEAVHLGKVIRTHEVKMRRTRWPRPEVTEATLGEDYIVYAAEGVAPGDDVVIPIGSPTPFIIRQQNKESDLPSKYRLMSDCWTMDDRIDYRCPKTRIMNGDYINQMNRTTIHEYRIV